MRLKQLEVIGFKSFAQRTALDFPAGITAIVGPNGCGKSNVVDAIRWVLGEQSPKHLRGDSMEDVIFKGNDRVAPTGMAQVSLTFENTQQTRALSELDLDVSTIPAHFRELAEIMVTRRLFRSGESEYFINKTPCRLKDITELFLGTGVGSKAYAIIEQGRVEQLINAKPEDRRLFIEEAAGTTLYRSRKLAAERKMERTRENLLRVSDVLRELERQIQYLHRLAKKAEQFRNLQEEIRQLDLALSSAQWCRLATGFADLEADLARAREQEQELVGHLTQLEGQRGGKQAAQLAADEDLARWRETSAVLESECQSLQQRVELLTKEVGERDRRISRLETEATTLAQQHEEMRAAARTEEQERSACAQLLLLDEDELQCKEAELAAARSEVGAAQSEVDALKNAVVGLVAREAECRNALAAQVRRRDETRRRLEKLAVEQAEVAQRLADVESAAEARKRDVGLLRERLRTAEGEKEYRAERVRALAEERRDWERHADQAHEAVLQLRSRLASLEELQRNHEGYTRGVRSILREAVSQAGVMGVVADVLDVPVQYERAVAAALGDRLQYVIVRDGEDGVGAVTTLRHEDSGRGSFIPLTPRKIDLNGHGASSLNGGTRRLLDLVKVDERYRNIAESLLGEVVLVSDLTAGLALWRQNGVHVTMVTPDGDTIDAAGVITGGSERPVEEEIVARRRLLGELTTETAAGESQLALAQQEFQRLTVELEEQDTGLKALDRDLHALTLDLVAAEKDLERLDGERPRWLDRLDVIRFEQSTTTAEESESTTVTHGVQAELADVTAQREMQEVSLHDSQARVVVAVDRVEDLSVEVTGIKVRAAEGRQRHEAAVATLGRLQDQIAEMSTRTTAIGAERDETIGERVGLRNDADAAAARRVEQLGQREAADAQIVTARARLDAAGAAVAEHDRVTHDTRERLDTVRAQCSQFEVALAERRLRVEHLVQGVRDKYGVEVADLPLAEELANEEDATARLDTLREKVARIGEVNVGAIDELRELEERAQFLRTQKDDLERSLADLERTIQRLNRASRAKFAETFAAVNEKFQTVLPRLFRGGEARLVLTDEHNLLETGVEIVVRPPGKRLETVTLLSGGEKALVAVSLIFSLFLINPTPFCFLDEVDAPLDDANIGRFTDLVQQMSEHSQFVVITHNKRTMQAANVLYGVTMQEPGVSKVISVAMQ